MRDFFRQYIIYSVGIAVNRFAMLLLLPLYTQFLSPTDYGILDTLVTFTALLQPMILVGVDTAVQILFYDKQITDKGARDNLVITSVLVVVACAGVFTVLGLIFSPSIASVLLGNTHYVFELQLLCLDMFVVGLLKLFHDNLRLRQSPLLYSLVSLLQLGCMTALNLLFIVVQQRGVSGYIYGLVLADAAVMLLTALFVLQHYRSGRFVTRYASMLLSLGWPLLPVSLAYWVLNLSNRFFLIKFSSTEAVGLFGIASRLAAGIGVFTLAIQIGWRPFALSMQGQSNARETYAAAPHYYFALIGWLGLLVAACSTLLIEVFTTPAYVDAAMLLTPLVLAQIAYGAYFIFSTGLEIMKRTYHLTWTIVLAAVVSVVLNLWLIPIFGAFGAALATSVAYLSAAVSVALVSQFVYPLPYHKRHFATVGLLLVLAYTLITVFNGLSLPYTAPLGLLVVVISGAVLLYLFKRDLHWVFDRVHSLVAPRGRGNLS
jgi:O-antigen/teichoic acid export membrane protein